MFLFLVECQLSGPLPELFDTFGNLIVLGLAKNNLSGILPKQWPASLKVLMVEDNPKLAGTITKDLIVQCDSIQYGGCKQRWECTTEEKAAGVGWMKGPFIVGVSFASENVGCLLECRDDCGITHQMLKDPPPKGDTRFSMYSTHGEGWVSWQEVWLSGLRELRDRKVFVMVGDGEPKFKTEQEAMEDRRRLCEESGEDWERETQLFLKELNEKPWEPEDKSQFKRKFLERQTAEDNSRKSFDPTFELPKGVCAHSILDWERRHMLHVAAENNLEVVYLDADQLRLTVRTRPEWYSDVPSTLATMLESVSVS